MKHHRTLITAITAAIVFTALLAATAHALPEFLPLTNNRHFTGITTGTTTVENSAGTKLECTASKIEGGLETDTLGTFHLTLEGCESSGVKCTTEGDTSGLILTEGSLHYVYSTLGTGETLGVAILFLPKETDFSCLGGSLNNKIKGTILCLMGSPLTSSITHAFRCEKGAAAGNAKLTKYWNDGGTVVAVQLLSNLNEGGFKESNEQMSSTLTTALAAAWMNE